MIPGASRTGLLLMLAWSLTGTLAGAKETYTVDPAHSDVTFRVRHLVSYVTGSFGEFSGTILLNRDNLANSSVEFAIRAASIDTANQRRDEHLRSEDFFHADKFPDITFKSAKITKAAGDTYDVTGRLSMHGVTKVITVPVEVLGFVAHPQFGERAGFTASFSVNREDYGITWNMPMGADALVLGNEVRIQVNVEAMKPLEAPGE